LYKAQAKSTVMADRYSFSLTTFSPSGKLVQIEYALQAVNQGATSVGIKGARAHLPARRCVRACRRVWPHVAGATATNGVVIATEKKTQSVLIDESTIEKARRVCVCSCACAGADARTNQTQVSNVTRGIGVVYSGMGGDARVLVNKARKAAQKYRAVYNEYPPTSMLVQEVASVMQEFTQSGCVSVARSCGGLRAAPPDGASVWSGCGDGSAV
jgi:20S proteasome subunit alpha 2